MAGRRWTETEDTIVRLDAWRPAGWSATAAKTGRTVAALANRATVLRKRWQPVAKKARRGRVRRWTEAEDRRVLSGADIQALAVELKRTPKAVQLRRYHLQGPTGTKPKRVGLGERRKMAAMRVDGATIPEIAEAFGRSQGAVKRAIRLSEAPSRKPRPYSAGEDKRIRDGVAAREPIASIARDIGRKSASVLARAERLGCRPMRTMVRSPWSARELRRALDMADAQRMTYAAIGAVLGRSKHSVAAAIQAHRRRKKGEGG